MFGKPFNHKLPAGEVWGDSRFAYDQGGQLYNAQKQPVDGNGNVMPLAKPVVEDVAPASNPVPVAAPVTSPDDDIPADEREFDVVAWARGDETLKATPWQAVRAAVAREIEDMTAITGKEAARKAILAKHGPAA